MKTDNDLLFFYCFQCARVSPPMKVKFGMNARWFACINTPQQNHWRYGNSCGAAAEATCLILLNCKPSILDTIEINKYLTSIIIWPSKWESVTKGKSNFTTVRCPFKKCWSYWNLFIIFIGASVSSSRYIKQAGVYSAKGFEPNYLHPVWSKVQIIYETKW